MRYRCLMGCLLLLTMTTISCTKEQTVLKGSAFREPLSELQWQKLATRRIYFGHQSVGADVLSGIRKLQEQSHHNNWPVVSNDDPEKVQGPALIESFIGQNGNPASKNTAFRKVLEKGFGDEGGIALYKYCFVDVRPETDVNDMFAGYRENISLLKAQFPHLTIVHVTIPLTTVEPGWKAFLKKVLGRPTERSVAEKRHRFNQLLRQQYAGKEPIFDLAEAESTLPDGERTYFVEQGEKIYTLAPGYTYDGGHLNEAGQKMTAIWFVQILAQL